MAEARYELGTLEGPGHYSIQIQVRVLRRFRVRLWIATKIMRLGARILPANASVDMVVDDG